ncbi:hypothetical protein BBJ28_00019694 [Nothophytophthora sp. Chile5]|nr:hypothetical protein BBJ28_00019694 [Nothophytophthora sp. Chile5]
MASPPSTSASGAPNSSVSPPPDPSPSVAGASTSDVPANPSAAEAPRGVLTLLGSTPFTPYAPWIDEVELPARGGPPPTRCPSCVRGASVNAAVIAPPALDPGILQAAVSSIQSVLAHGEDLRRVQADYLALQDDHSAMLQHAGGLHRQLRSSGRLIRPFASFFHDKVDGLCQALGNAKLLAAEYISHNERLNMDLTETEDLRADYDALERQDAEQEGKQATQIRELELRLSTAQGNPPSTPSRDLQLLALASAKDAALTEVAGQRRRIEILEAGQQTLKDRLERERADRAFEADRLQTKVRKFRQQRNQLRDQQTKARADLAAAMGAHSRALSDAAELRKLRANFPFPRGDLRGLTPSSPFAFHRPPNGPHARQCPAAPGNGSVGAGPSSWPTSPPEASPVAGGSADPDVTRPRKSRRSAAAPKEESKTEDDGVVANSSAASGNAVADDSDGAVDSSQKSGASDDRGAGNIDDQADGDDSGEGGISSDDDTVRVAFTRSRSDVRRSSVEVTELMAAEPWSVLDVRVPALTFDPNLSMGDLAEAYGRLEDTYRQAYWESTHYLPITGAMRQADPVLDAYCGERKQRRSHASGRWKKILAMILRLMREHLCDLDLLLDPFFLQFPALGESGSWYPGIEDGADPATLLDALVISDAADSWRNHHRDAMADHPSMDILRLEDKFVPQPLAAP